MRNKHELQIRAVDKKKMLPTEAKSIFNPNI